MTNRADLRLRQQCLLTALVLVGFAAAPAGAQVAIRACYVADLGLVYRIGETGLPTACQDPTHVEFSWNEQGPEGPAGADGATGSAGAQGEQGIQGPQGIQGETGPSGLAADQGAIGPAGAQGIQGIQGETGPSGPAGTQGAIGPAGAQGAQGDQGIQGETGASGPAGEQGDQGIQGETGDSGPEGEQGDPGATGPTGPAGSNGLLDWELIETEYNGLTADAVRSATCSSGKVPLGGGWLSDADEEVRTKEAFLFSGGGGAGFTVAIDYTDADSYDLTVQVTCATPVG